MNKIGLEQEKRNINPGLSAILSFAFSGLGQLYNGEIRKGLLIIFLNSIGVILMVVGAVLLVNYLICPAAVYLELEWGVVFSIIGIVLICCIGTYGIFDAYNEARRKLLE